jgi:hypothetical protein
LIHPLHSMDQLALKATSSRVLCSEQEAFFFFLHKP